MQAMYVEPSSQGEPRVTHIDFDPRSGRFDAMLEIPAGAAKRTALRLSGRAAATVEVATVTRTIERGGVLKDSDVLMERRPRAEIGRDVITRREQAVDFAARNSLQPGRPLRLVDLTKPDLVQRNETVTLVYEVPGIMLTIRGKAAEGGAEGDAISVLNEQSKRTVQGTIIGPGRVLVSNGSRRLASNNASRENYRCCRTLNLRVLTQFRLVPWSISESKVMKVVMVMRHAVLAALASALLNGCAYIDRLKSVGQQPPLTLRRQSDHSTGLQTGADAHAGGAAGRL